MTHDSEKPESHPEAVHQQKDLVDLVKGNGPWQWMICAVVLAISFPDGANNMSMVFMAPNMNYWCARPPEYNLSSKEWKESALQPHNARCSRYRYINTSLTSDVNLENNGSIRETEACDSWEYDHSIYTSTIVSQWDLVCDREWLVSMSKSIFVTGYLLSSTLFAYLTDKYGRKPLILACNILAILSGISCLCSTSFLMFAISRFFVAAGATGSDHAATILMIEAVSPKYRAPYYVGVGMAWLAGALHLPLLAWWLRDWQWMEAAIILPSVLFLSIWWLLPESPRWLLAHGKTDEALKILSKAAKTNGLKISSVKLKEMVTTLKEPDETEKPKTRVLQLFKPELRVQTSVMWFIWTVTAFVYYGIAYNTNELAGDPSVNFLIYNLIDIPASLLTLTIIHYKGRRRPLAANLACSGIACLLAFSIPDDLGWLRISVSLVGKFFISATFAVLGLFTNEIFPTILRNTGYGSCSAVSRIGAILAPFVRELGRANHPLIPQILFGVLTLTAGGLALLLPETSNCSVPDTVREAGEISRKSDSKNQAEEKWILLGDFNETNETEYLLSD